MFLGNAVVSLIRNLCIEEAPESYLTPPSYVAVACQYDIVPNDIEEDERILLSFDFVDLGPFATVRFEACACFPNKAMLFIVIDVACIC